MTCSCVFGSRCALAMFLRIAPRKAVRHTAMSAPRGVLESFQLEFVTGSRQTPVLAVSFRHEQSAENPGFKPSALAATQSLGGEQIALSSTEPMAMQHVKRDLLHLLVGKLHLFVSFARPLLPQLQFKLALSARPTDMGASVGDGTPAIAVLHGSSERPLYVTAIGCDVDDAAENVRAMHGPYRIPTMLRLADSLARS